MAIVGKKVRVYMQVDDKIFDISGDVESFSVSEQSLDVTAFGDAMPHYISTFVEANISMVGNGVWKLVDDFHLPKTKTEWRCDFCGHVNPLDARYCGHADKHAVGCGARRSFLLDIEHD